MTGPSCAAALAALLTLAALVAPASAFTYDLLLEGVPVKDVTIAENTKLYYNFTVTQSSDIELEMYLDSGSVYAYANPPGQDYPTSAKFVWFTVLELGSNIVYMPRDHANFTTGAYTLMFIGGMNSVFDMTLRTFTVNRTLDAQEAVVVQEIYDDCCKSNISCAPWKALGGKAENVCTMTGSYCDPDGHIVQLNLGSQNLGASDSGGGCAAIKESFVLSRLAVLDLSNNQIQAPYNTIAEVLARSPRVNRIKLQTNRLYGSLSCTFTPETSPQLVYLGLSGNLLTGTLPSCFVPNLVSIKTLDIARNNLTGMLPEVWAPEGSPGTLSQIDLQSQAGARTGGGFYGTLPHGVFRLPELTLFSASANSLSGTIPDLRDPTTGAVLSPKLSQFLISGNKISGTIPQWAAEVPLTSFEVSFNQLSGPLPKCFTSGNTLKTLKVDNNMLSGVLPDEWGSQSLLLFDGSRNQFEGSIPRGLASLTGLLLLNLGNNRLSGEVKLWERDENEWDDTCAQYNSKIEGDPFYRTKCPAPNCWLRGDRCIARAYPNILIMNVSGNYLRGKLHEENSELSMFDGKIVNFGGRPVTQTFDISHNRLQDKFPHFLLRGVLQGMKDARGTRFLQVYVTDNKFICPLDAIENSDLNIADTSAMAKRMSWIRGIRCELDYSDDTRDLFKYWKDTSPKEREPRHCIEVVVKKDYSWVAVFPVLFAVLLIAAASRALALYRKRKLERQEWERLAIDFGKKPPTLGADVEMDPAQMDPARALPQGMDPESMRMMGVDRDVLAPVIEAHGQGDESEHAGLMTNWIAPGHAVTGGTWLARQGVEMGRVNINNLRDVPASEYSESEDDGGSEYGSRYSSEYTNPSFRSEHHQPPGLSGRAHGHTMDDIREDDSEAEEGPEFGGSEYGTGPEVRSRHEIFSLLIISSRWPGPPRFSLVAPLKPAHGSWLWPPVSWQ